MKSFTLSGLFENFAPTTRNHRSKRALRKRPLGSWLGFEPLEDRTLLTAGALDPTFDGDGKTTTDFGSQSIDFVEGTNSLALQGDGKILVAGSSFQDGTDWDFAIVRYNSDGSLDSSFGTAGKVIVDFGAGDFANSVAVQANGKIVVAGYKYWGGADFAVARLNSDGTLDSTFAIGGTETMDLGGFDSATNVAVQPDGRIVLGGRTSGGSATSDDFAVARLNSDGSLDTTFDSDGKQTIGFGFTQDTATGMTLQSDGKIVMVGYSRALFGGPSDFAVARLSSNGSLDNSFGVAGREIIDFGTANDNARGVAIQSDGKLVVVGDSGGDFAVARLNSDSSLDLSFDGDGKQTISIGVDTGDLASGVTIQSDGKIVMAGESIHVDELHFAAARLNSDGRPDNSFGPGGGQTIDLGTVQERASSVAVQSDGKIVVAGTSYSGIDQDFAVTRLLGYVAVQTVAVDIRPESLNVDSNGTLSVVILGAVDFNAAQVDVGSVRFAGAGAWQSTLTDVNHDGRLDLQLKFRTQDTILDEIYSQLLQDDFDADGVLDSTRQVAEVAVTGQTLDDVLFSGSDDLNLFLSGKSLRNLLDDLFG